MPTLVLVGERDLATPPNEAAAVASALANATLLVFPGLGHVVTVEQACARDLLARFIDTGVVPDERCGAAPSAQP